jgi:type IV pilus assembly protein PilN
MRIQVNLASKPYVELRPIYKRLQIWMAILAVLAIPLWLLLRSEQQQAQQATARVQAVQSNIQRLQRQQQSYQALMRQPQNAAILEQSDYLNSLFRRKAFSWTATMSDLETVLPSGLQVLSIDPVVAKDGHVTIRMRVSGARDRAVELVRNLEKSKHFVSPRLADETLATANTGTAAIQPVNATGDVNFDILADYRPLQYSEVKLAQEKPAQSEAPKAGPTMPKPRRTPKAAGGYIPPNPSPQGGAR